MPSLLKRSQSWTFLGLVALNLLVTILPANALLLNRSNIQKAADPVFRRPHHRRSHSKASEFPQSEVPDARPPLNERLFISNTVEQVILDVGEIIKDDTLRQIFSNCLPSTLDTTVLFHRNASQSGIPYTYIITGDIPAMWLRDSTYQINPYVPLAKNDPKLRQLVLGVINTQAEMILEYAYGNAFFPLKHWNSGIRVEFPPASASDSVYPEYDRSEVFEAKYELDSLASFLYLSKYYFESTGDSTFVLNPKWIQAVNKTLTTMKKQQGGTIEVFGREPFKFTRPTRTQSETQNLYGIGNPVKRCGLVRSFFRPSDDSTIFQYLIPANALAVVGLDGVANIIQTVVPEMYPELLDEIIYVGAEIREAIQTHGVVRHPHFGEVYAYEVDCYGSHLFMDDANFPSILSMAKFGFVPKDDPTYLNSRRYILSPDWNPYYAAGKFPGIGSPHTGLKKPWPMALAMQAMTSNDEAEIVRMLEYLRNTTAGTGFMHESYDVNNPNSYTRPWFAWANTVFGDLILHLAEEYPHLLAGERPRRSTQPRNRISQ